MPSSCGRRPGRSWHLHACFFFFFDTSDIIEALNWQIFQKLQNGRGEDRGFAKTGPHS
jgi:hypothetical protein